MGNKIEIVANNQSSDDLYGDIIDGQLCPMELVVDKDMAKKIQSAIYLVQEYANALEDAIEIC